jgi:hypothetical protein
MFVSCLADVTASLHSTVDVRSDGCKIRPLPLIPMLLNVHIVFERRQSALQENQDIFLVYHLSEPIV